MKLSLTAIAALSATFFHPTVATGTRAAASNGNTKADEAKPQRDLFVDLADVAPFFEDLDEIIDGGTFEEGREANILGKVIAAKSVAELVLWIAGDAGTISVNAVKELTGLPDVPVKLDGGDDNDNGEIDEDELTQLFTAGTSLRELAIIHGILFQQAMLQGYRR
jgi:hypothetical protein